MENGERKILMSAAGKTGLGKRIAEIEGIIARESKQIGEAGGSADFHDNFSFEEAQRQVTMWTAELARLGEILRNCELIHPRQETENVGIGNIVVLDFGDETERLALLGPVDATYLKNVISNESPVGKGIMGKKKGDSVVITHPNGQTTVKILEIFPSNPNLVGSNENPEAFSEALKATVN